MIYAGLRSLASKLSWIQHPAAFCEEVLDVSQNKLDAVSAEHLKGVGGIPWNGLWVDLSVNLTWNQLCQGLDTLKTEKAKHACSKEQSPNQWLQRSPSFPAVNLLWTEMIAFYEVCGSVF